MKHLLATLILALSFLSLLATTAHGRQGMMQIGPVGGPHNALRVDLWTDREEGSVYYEGESVEIYFRAADDCFLTLYNIATDGTVQVLFPRYPDDGYVYGGVTYRLPDYYDDYRLPARGPRGVEYLHAVATRRPGAFRYRTRRGGYGYRFRAVAGDPFLAMNRINGRLLSRSYIHATATTSFFVGGIVWYPRYLCNDCHAGNRIGFDPYMDVCPRYTVRTSRRYDYWWKYRYHPVSARFAFGGPFWSVDVRIGPYRPHRSPRYLNCGYGYTNYYPLVKPHRPHTSVTRRSGKTRAVKRYERSYKHRTYDKNRTHADTRVRRSSSGKAGKVHPDGARVRTSTDKRVRVSADKRAKKSTARQVRVSSDNRAKKSTDKRVRTSSDNRARKSTDKRARASSDKRSSSRSRSR